MGSILFGWWSWHPPVGVWIGILGLLGVLVTLIRENIGRREKAVWTFVMFALLLLEIKSVYQDRSEHDEAERTARQRSEENFRTIANGVNATIATTEQQFEATMSEERTILGTTQSVAKLAEKNLENVMGAKSVGYIVPQWDGSFVLHNDGQNILSVTGVTIEHNFEKLYESGSLGTVAADGLVILPAARIPPLDFTHEDSLMAFITAQNGWFTELITFRRGIKGRPFEYKFEVRKHIELCRPNKHPNESSLIDCPHGLSEDRLVYLRNWTDEPQFSSTQLKKLLQHR